MWESVRKYGLEYCDLPTLLENMSSFLRVLTLNVDSRNTKPIPLSFYIITLVSAASYFYVYLVSMVWFVFVRCMQTGDLLSGLIVFSLGITSEIGIYKLVFMFIYVKKVRHIVEQCLACDSHVPCGSRYEMNLLITLRVVKKRVLLFWTFLMLNAVIYLVKPFLLPGRHLVEDIFIMYGLSPMYETPNYEIGYIITMAAVAFTCLTTTNTAAFLMVTAGYTEGQLISLSQELLHLWDDAEDNYKTLTILVENIDDRCVEGAKNKAVNEYVNSHLKEIIRMHAINITLGIEIDDIFRNVIAVEFGLLVVALIVELLGGLENTYLQMPFGLMQVAMDCITGQKLINASVAFEQAVYACKWERFDKANMRFVLTMLQIAHKGLKLSAGGVAILSFTCLMTVLRSIYSAYTTLRPMMQ